jgi:hypothetical protein
MEFFQNCIPHFVSFTNTFGIFFSHQDYIKDLSSKRQFIETNILSEIVNETEYYTNIAKLSQEYCKKWIALRNIIRSNHFLFKTKRNINFLWSIEEEDSYEISSSCFTIESFFTWMNYAISLHNCGIVRFKTKQDFVTHFQMSISAYSYASNELEHMTITNTLERELLVLWNLWMMDITILHFLFLHVLKTQDDNLSILMYQKAKEFSLRCKIFFTKDNSNNFCNVLDSFTCFTNIYTCFEDLYTCIKMVSFFLIYKKHKFNAEYSEAFDFAELNFKKFKSSNIFMFPEMIALSNRIETDIFHKTNTASFRHKNIKDIKELLLNQKIDLEELDIFVLSRLELDLEKNYDVINRSLKLEYKE